MPNYTDEREKIKAALEAGHEYAHACLVNHDDAYKRHPATEAERAEIVADLAIIDEALALLSDPAPAENVEHMMSDGRTLNQFINDETPSAPVAQDAREALIPAAEIAGMKAAILRADRLTDKEKRREEIGYEALATAADVFLICGQKVLNEELWNAAAIAIKRFAQDREASLRHIIGQQNDERLAIVAEMHAACDAMQDRAESAEARLSAREDALRAMRDDLLPAYWTVLRYAQEGMKLYPKDATAYEAIYRRFAALASEEPKPLPEISDELVAEYMAHKDDSALASGDPCPHCGTPLGRVALNMSHWIICCPKCSINFGDANGPDGKAHPEEPGKEGAK